MMSGDFGQADRIRRERKLIVHDMANIQGTISIASDIVMTGNAESELIMLMDRLMESISNAEDAVSESIAFCERERTEAAGKLGTLRTSRRALNSYARYGGAN